MKTDKEAKSLPSIIEPCVVGSLKYVYHLSTSAIWIDNCRKSFHHKKKKQFYIQTYHGGAAGKNVKKMQKISFQKNM